MNIEYVELTANYFEKKLKKNYNKIELRCNLKELIGKKEEEKKDNKNPSDDDYFDDFFDE